MKVLSFILMSDRFFYKLLSLVLIICFFSCSEKIVSSKNPYPNILLILTDDQGYGDLSFTGNDTIETPTIDKLASEGAFANHFYVSPVCAPTRASILTGRYHQRTGVTGVTRGREDMRLYETTMADILKEVGYRTGIFGKWHNGAHYPYHPLGRGFDEFVGFTSGHWSNYFDTIIEKNGTPFKTHGYLPDVLTSEAIRFMQESHNSAQPFLCYVPFQTPHTPLQVPDKYFDKYKAKGLDDFNACIYGMCENVDDNVGRLLNALDEMQISNNTIVIYLSDNGPLNDRFNLGLKGRKGDMDEGGVRVPFIIKWPEKVKKGLIIDEALAHIDMLPTLMDLIGIDYKSTKPMDGLSFKPLLEGTGTIPDRLLYNEFFAKERILRDPYLMVADKLFDVRKDLQQKNNLRTQHPEIYDSLRKYFDLWLAEVKPQDEEQKFIPVGYDSYPVTTLPAHEAHLFPPFEARKNRQHTGIAYHSLYGWAHDWIDFWTSTDAYAQWYVEVVNTAMYKIEMDYALAPNDIGTELEITLGNEKITFDVKDAFEHSHRESHDRVIRLQEAPETDWATLAIGNIELTKGRFDVTVKAKTISGKKSIELKAIRLIKRL